MNSMDDLKTIPPMKPVLVTKASDDIATLQKTDVTQQQTILTARALYDFDKCAPFNASNPTDAAFFNSDSKLDLNKVDVASHRMVLEGTYVNGPSIYQDKVAGDKQFYGNHSFEEVFPTAYVYTFAVLPDGNLEWNGYDGIIPIECSDTIDRSVKARAKSPHIRQIFFVNHNNEYYDSEYRTDIHRSRKDVGVPYTRLGTLVGDTYTWESWYLMGKSHDGAEYSTSFVYKTDTTGIKPFVDSIHHVYAATEFTLPNANLDGYKTGMKIVIEVHPPLVEGGLSVAKVNYKDTDKTGAEIADAEDMVLVITPKFQHLMNEESGALTSEQVIPSVATFEIVDLTDSSGNVIGRTWELDAGVEETDFTAGLAQILREHIEPATGDFVLYKNDAIKANNSIKLGYAVPSCGYVLASFLKTAETADSIWSAQVFAINLDSDATFVQETSATPYASRIYFVKMDESGEKSYIICDNNGHPTSFESGVTYYYIDEEHSSKTQIIEFTKAAATTNVLKLEDLTVDTKKSFSRFLNRNDLIVVYITHEGKTIEQYRDWVEPTVQFFPDPHGSYVMKRCVNPSAYTNYQVQQLLDNGAFIPSSDKDALETPASTRALINAYLYLAYQLQSKGLLHGNVRDLGLGDQILNHYVTSGFYWVSALDEPSEHSSWPPNIEPNVGMNLIVLSSRSTSAANYHLDEGPDSVVYEADRVTQIILTEDTDGAKIWVRMGDRITDSSEYEFTSWISFLDGGDWGKITNKPLYFQSRWDYIADPNTILDRVDKTTYKNIDTTNSVYEVGVAITKDEVLAAMAKSSNPGYDTTVKYKVPIFMVGRLNCDVTDDDRQVMTEHSLTAIHYVVDVELPDATVTQLGADAPDDRRKVNFMFIGRPDKEDWDKIVFRLHYLNSDGTSTYSYVRTWTGSVKSMISLEFEQIDLPGTERVWSPVEIG